FESARPKREDGERESLTLPRYLAMVAGTITPVLLFLHLVGATVLTGAGSPITLGIEAVQSGNFSDGPGAALIVGIAALLVAVVVASIRGLVIAGAAPGLGRALQTPAPFISILVLAFVIYAAWTNAWYIINPPTAIFVVRYVN